MSEVQPPAEMPESQIEVRKHYSGGLIAFHWVSALLVLVLLATGWWMLELIRDPARMKSAFPIFQFHKSLGILVFVLTLGRIAVRMRRKAPSLPNSMPSWERFAALAAQAAFYLLLIAIPLVGWLYISTEWAESLDKEFKAPTLFFGQFEVPYANFVSEAEAGLRRSLSFRLSAVHAWLAYSLLALIALHTAAALKHHLVNRDNVLSHMAPMLRQRSSEDESSGLHLKGLGDSKVWVAAGVAVAVVAALGWIGSPAPTRQAGAETAQSASR